MHLHGEKKNLHAPPPRINIHRGHNSPQCSPGQQRQLHSDARVVSLYAMLVRALSLDVLERDACVRVAVFSQALLIPITRLYFRYPTNVREMYNVNFKTLP